MKMWTSGTSGSARQCELDSTSTAANHSAGVGGDRVGPSHLTRRNTRRGHGVYHTIGKKRGLILSLASQCGAAVGSGVTAVFSLWE